MAASFPDLEAERARLDFSLRARDRMIARLEAVDPASAADEITSEYIEMTVWEALEDLRIPGAGDFFGRIDVRDDGLLSRSSGGSAGAEGSAGDEAHKARAQSAADGEPVRGSSPSPIRSRSPDETCSLRLAR